MKKHLTIIITAIVVLVITVVWVQSYRASTVCKQTSLSGECLPEGKCSAPNDAIVDCEKLKQNPTKTDWLGNE